jgi:Flp pilus assembly protein protease CpaA
VWDALAAPWPFQVALLVTLAALTTSVVTDLRERRIPNALTLPALVIVFGLLGLAGGWPLVWNAFLGGAACAVPLLFAALPGWIGMGDVKLIAISGAAAGWPGALSVLLLVALAGGVQAILQWIWAVSRGRERPRYVPYACSIAAGTVAAFLLG